MSSSRTRHLEETLAILKFEQGLKAFDLVVEEMCKEKGYQRHNGTHYYYHCNDVTQKLINHGLRDQDIICASLLHDIIEDVPGYNYEVLQEMFNPRVADIVQRLTKWDGFDASNPEDFHKYLNLIFENYGASLIKASDQMHNFSTLKDATPEKRYRKAIEMETYYIPFFKQCRKQYRRYASFFFEAKTQIEPHIWAYKNHFEETQKLKSEIEELKKQIKND